MTQPAILLRTKKIATAIRDGYYGATDQDVFTLMSIDLSSLGLSITSNQTLVFVDATAMFNVYDGYNHDNFYYAGALNKSACVMYQPGHADGYKIQDINVASVLGVSASKTKYVTLASNVDPEISFGLLAHDGTRKSLYSTRDSEDAGRFSMEAYSNNAAVLTPSGSTLNINVCSNVTQAQSGQPVVYNHRIYWYCETTILVVQQDTY